MNSQISGSTSNSTSGSSNKEPEFPLITLKDVAELTGIPYKTLWRNKENIPGYRKMFGKAFYVKEELVEFLKPKKS
jgi:predicted DNA-binding transcriptional regulator AlpA